MNDVVMRMFRLGICIVLFFGIKGNVNAQSHGMFTDSRDSTSYQWVKINNQVWMNENLAYMPVDTFKREFSDSLPYYYTHYGQAKTVQELRDSNWLKPLGLLYNYAAAKNACPQGWRLPTKKEWRILSNYAMSNYQRDNDTVIKGALEFWSGKIITVNPFTMHNFTHGYLTENGTHIACSLMGCFWLSGDDKYDYNIPIIFFAWGSDRYSMNFVEKSAGVAIRCVKE